MASSNKIPFSRYIKESNVSSDQISFNELSGRGSSTSEKPSRIKLSWQEVYRLVRPYISVRILEQAKAVLPLAIYLGLFQLLILREPVSDALIISGGLVAVIIGLMIFMEGLKVGLMPFGEALGTSLPAKASLVVVLLIAFLLGIGVTFAEPAIGALQEAGSLVDVAKAPYLYALLNEWSLTLVLSVGAGVGLAAAIGTVRFIYGWSLKPLIYITLAPVLLITIFMATDSQLSTVLGLAFDCGAVTTGPVTVPLVLALGIGIANAAGKGGDSLSGFGIVTLASLFPIIAVMSLALYVSSQFTPEQIISAASASASSMRDVGWYEVTPGLEVVGGVRAIVPLVIFLLIVMVAVLRERVPSPNTIFFGIFLCVLGMIVFNLGLSYGLSKLGGQSGGLVPAAFTQIDSVASS